MEFKKCSGQFHPPGGELVPLDQYTFNNTGPRAGKPLSRCKLCRSAGNSTTVPAEFFMPVVDSLLLNKSAEEVTELTGIKKQVLRDIIEGKKNRVHKKTFFALKRAESSLPRIKTSIGPQHKRTSRNELTKLGYEDRIALKQLVSIVQKERFKKDKQLLRHVV